MKNSRGFAAGWVIAIIVGLAVLVGGYLLIANKTPQQPRQQQAVSIQETAQNTLAATSTANTTSQQNNIVIANLQYIHNHPHESAFLIYGSDGALLKTIPAPSDLITGYAGNIQVFGNEIYYMSGTPASTSVGVLDPRTGQSKILDFTKTTGTAKSLSNSLFSIASWSVADDGSKIAWLTSDGQLKIANIDGSNLQTLDSSISNPFGSISIELVNNSVWFQTNTGEKYNLERIDLATGKTDLISNDVSPYEWAVSGNGEYAAYRGLFGGPVTIQNLNSGARLSYNPSHDNVGISFSPDSNRLLVSSVTSPGDPISEAIILDPSNADILDDIKGLPVFDFLSGSRIVVSASSGIAITDLNGSTNTVHVRSTSTDVIGILSGE